MLDACLCVLAVGELRILTAGARRRWVKEMRSEVYNHKNTTNKIPTRPPPHPNSTRDPKQCPWGPRISGAERNTSQLLPPSPPPSLLLRSVSLCTSLPLPRWMDRSKSWQEVRCRMNLWCACYLCCYTFGPRNINRLCHCSSVMKVFSNKWKWKLADF